MYLIDTNIFLEILLGQEKKESCKNFLHDNHASLSISDFSLHSIGVILFKHKKADIFTEFCGDILHSIDVVTLSKEIYARLAETKVSLKLDFDDAYQYLIAKEHGLKIVTMDDDFKRAKDRVPVIFL